MLRVLIVLFFFSFFGLHAQHSGERIPWAEDRPLQWEDFRGPADYKLHFDATTTTGIQYSWSLRTKGNDSEFFYEVFTGFDPENSWVKEGKRSEHLLAHEQLHFDITEWHARKLRKELSSYQVSPNAKRELDQMYKRVNRERIKIQKRYDLETRHSQDTLAQQKWQALVKNELEKLRDFSN